MKTHWVIAGAVFAAFVFTAEPVQAQCGECEVFFFNKHSVCGWVPFSSMEPGHCERTTPANCNGHWFCEEDEDDSAAQELLADYLAGHDVSLMQIRLAIASSDRIVLNRERRAIQVYDCDRSEVVAHIPVPQSRWWSLAQ